MKIGADRLEIVTDGEISALKGHGVSWIGHYVSSPCQRRTRLSPEAVKRIWRAGWDILPIYVGSNTNTELYTCETADLSLGSPHGADAVKMVRQLGFQGGPVVLDVEYATSVNQVQAAAKYFWDWAQVVRLGGYHPVLYGAAHLLNAIGDGGGHWSAWIADWINRAGQSTPGSPPALNNIPGAHRTIRQYAPGPFDWNICQDEFFLESRRLTETPPPIAEWPVEWPQELRDNVRDWTDALWGALERIENTERRQALKNKLTDFALAVGYS